MTATERRWNCLPRWSTRVSTAAIWTCPWCGEEVPLAMEQRHRLWRTVITATNQSWTDFHAHLWTHEMEIP